METHDSFVLCINQMTSIQLSRLPFIYFLLLMFAFYICHPGSFLKGSHGACRQAENGLEAWEIYGQLQNIPENKFKAVLRNLLRGSSEEGKCPLWLSPMPGK